MRSAGLSFIVCACVCACGTEPSRADGNAPAPDDTIDGSSPSQDAVEDTAGQGGADTADVEISPDLSDGDGDGDVDDSDGDVTDDSEDDVTEESDDGINDEPDVETPGDGATDESDDTNGDGATDALPPVDADADDIGPDTSDVVSELPCPSQEGFLDNDGDGFGGVGARGCPDDDGFVTQGGDCNDDDDNVYPGAPELCDGRDNDCDGQLDEADAGVPTWVDVDGDSWGDTESGYIQCAATAGRVLRAGDCDDAEPLANPGLSEVNCDGIDNDCDGQADTDGCAFELWVETPLRPWFMLIDPTSTWLYWSDNISSVYRAPLDSPADFELITNRASTPRNLWIDPTSTTLLIADAQGVLRGSPDGGTFTRVFSHSVYGSTGLAALFGLSGTCTGDYSRALLWRDHLVIGLGSGNCGPLIVVEPDGDVRAVSDANIVGEWVTVQNDTLYYGRPVCRMTAPDATPECYGSELAMAGFQVDDSWLYAARRNGIFRWPLTDPAGTPTALQTWTECGFGFYQTNLALQRDRLFALDPCSSSVFAVNTDGTDGGPIAGTPSCMIAMVSTPGNLYVSECNRSRISRLRVPRLWE